MTGFNPDQVANSIANIEKAYEDLSNALGTQMQNDFVNAMANYWACSEAQTFFNNNFQPVINELLNGSFAIFESVINAMNAAAQVWAAQTGVPFTTKAFGGVRRSIDTSGIKENINGTRGVDEVNANATAGKLSAIATSVDAALTSAQTAVQESGFVGAEMEGQLVNSLQTIKTNVNNATRELTDTTKAAIVQTVQTYGDIARKVGTSFSA